MSAGLKRYFHAKRMEGLLSARGLRILDSGCDELLEGEEGKPLQLWAIIRRWDGARRVRVCACVCVDAVGHHAQVGRQTLCVCVCVSVDAAAKLLQGVAWRGLLPCISHRAPMSVTAPAAAAAASTTAAAAATAAATCAGTAPTARCCGC
jgi:hypothetical protein